MFKKPIAAAFALVLAAAPVAGSTALAAQTNTYQVTGPILEVRDDAVVVQKGKEKWEIARNAETKITGELKVGAKVTVEYRMAAAGIEVKGPKGAKAEAKPAEAKPAEAKPAEAKPAEAKAAK